VAGQPAELPEMTHSRRSSGGLAALSLRSRQRPRGRVLVLDFFPALRVVPNRRKGAGQSQTKARSSPNAPLGVSSQVPGKSSDELQAR
jgi:hypothetical protein